MWKQSSFCDGGQCVEVSWPDCDGGACVQVGWGEAACGLIHVRDSKLGDASPVLNFTTDEWEAFLQGAAVGEFDFPK